MLGINNEWIEMVGERAEAGMIASISITYMNMWK